MMRKDSIAMALLLAVAAAQVASSFVTPIAWMGTGGPLVAASTGRRPQAKDARIWGTFSSLASSTSSISTTTLSSEADPVGEEAPARRVYTTPGRGDGGGRGPGSQQGGRGGGGRGGYDGGRGEGRGGRGGRGDFAGRGGVEARGGRGAPGGRGSFEGRGRGSVEGRGGGRGGRGPQEGRGGRGQYGRGQGGEMFGDGGGTGPILKLSNPLKMQRTVFVPAPRPAFDRAQDGGGRSGPPSRNSPGRDASRGPPRAGGAPNIGGGGDAPAEDADGTNIGKPAKRGAPVKIANKVYTKKGGEDDSSKRKNSLKLGTGKSNRGPGDTMRRGSLRKKDRSAERERKIDAALERRTVQLPDHPISVSDLADLIDEKPISVIKFLMTDLGVMASITQNLDPATCIAVAEGFGRVVGELGDDEFDDDMRDMLEDEDTAVATGFADDEDNEEDLEPRSPVITIMGHVDHGKTSLLDAIRNTKVTAGEAGGITQHINAYQVMHKGQAITFIDTPGHAAFTDMRERGANITDIVILVVAADDGVKQQTADSIVCARQAGVPLVIAINKCDLETADPSRVMSDLTAYDILSESLGGEVLTAEISAKTGFGLEDLLDKVMLQAEIEDLSANPNRAAQGAVVEARIERGLGTVATTLIQKGTLRVGDNFVAGSSYGRVRALIATDGKTRLTEAGPSTPVNVVGFEGVPAAGDILVVSADEQSARLIAENRQRIAREKVSTQYQSGLMGSANALFGGSSKEKREMCVVVKADVSGSAEALSRALRELKLENDEATVTIKVLVSETGEVTKSDIAVAGVSPDTTVIAFGVSASYDAMEDARAQRIPIEYFNIIYDAIESVESRMQEVLSPTPEGEYVGAATVQEVFNIGGTGNIAGSRCTDGYIRKGANVRVLRGDKILKYTSVRTLRNFKAETDRIEGGNECGIGLVDFEDYQPGDVIECFVVM